MPFRDTDLKHTEALARQEREYTESIVGSVRWLILDAELTGSWTNRVLLW